MQLDLLKIFDGYVKNYHTLNLTKHHGNHSFTMSEIEYFSRLGSMLGYDPFTEDTINGTYRPMDLSWWDNWDGEYWNSHILHLERENYFKKDIETLDKLLKHDEIPLNVIGILNVKDCVRIEELLDYTKKKCNVENALFIFRTNSDDNTKGYFNIVKAYLFNKSTKVAEKTAHISDISGTFYMHY